MKSLLFILTLVVLNLSTIAQIVSSTGSLNVPRYLHESQKLPDGKVIAFGGDNGNLLASEVYTSSEIYNPSTGSWALSGSMNEERSSFASAILPNGNILAIGGRNNNLDVSKTCEIYDVSSGTWSYTDSMVQERYTHHAVVLDNGKVLVVGGLPTTSSCELYDPSTGMWTQTGDNIYYRHFGFAMVKLNDGRVLVTGGDGETTSGEIYDPSTETWTLVSHSLIKSRRGHTMVVLDDGRVIIIGGSIAYDSAEIFDPLTETFTSTEDLTQVRSYTPAIKLDNGDVLVYGMGDFWNPFDSQPIEVYNVANQDWFSPVIAGGGVSSYTIHKLDNGLLLTVGGNVTTGNGSSSSCVLISQNIPYVSIAQLNNDELKYNVYPNPTSNFLHINIDEKIVNTGSDLIMKIFDISGKEIRSINLEQPTLSINIEDIAIGTYSFNIIGKGSIIYSSSFIKN